MEIDKKSSNDTNSNFSGSGYLSNFPAATINYVQISRNACDGEGITAVNASVNDEIKKERDALVKEKEDLVSNGVSTYYTDNTWSAYDTACTAAAATTTDWDMLNKIAPLKTAKDRLLKKEQQFENCNIALSGKIDMNFYTTVDENDTSKTPRFTSGGKTLEPVETAEGGKKVYTVKLPAKEMTDEITVEMYDETSGTIVDKVVYSIEDYAKELLKNDAYSSEMKALVKSMLNYGAAAQTQFGYHTDDLANKSLNDTDKNVGAIGNALDTFCGSQYITAENCVGYSLVLEAETALKLYFKDTDSSQITVKKGDALVEDLECGESNGLTYVKVPNIKAQNLNNVYTVYIGEDEAGTVSALTYCYQVAKGTYDAKLTNLVNALYDYNKKACAFVDSQQTSAD